MLCWLNLTPTSVEVDSTRTTYDSYKGYLRKPQSLSRCICFAHNVSNDGTSSKASADSSARWFWARFLIGRKQGQQLVTE